MHNEAAEIREQVDRQTRPGQKSAATVANRLVSGNVLGTGGTVPCNVYDWTAGENRRYGLYGRGRYGSERYRGVTP